MAGDWTPEGSGAEDWDAGSQASATAAAVCRARLTAVRGAGVGGATGDGDRVMVPVTWP